MKLVNKNLLILLIIAISLFCNIDAKLKTKIRNKQIVLGRPSAGHTVVSPVVEADELPTTSVINVGVARRPTVITSSMGLSVQPTVAIPSPNVLTTPIIRPSITEVTYHPAIPTIQTFGNAFLNGHDPNSLIKRK